MFGQKVVLLRREDAQAGKIQSRLVSGACGSIVAGIYSFALFVHHFHHLSTQVGFPDFDELALEGLVIPLDHWQMKTVFYLRPGWIIPPPIPFLNLTSICSLHTNLDHGFLAAVLAIPQQVLRREV